MYLNNIDFPNQILDAIQKNKLVVFAGAGASVDKPTSLPNFADLAKEIAEDTGKTLRKEPCEVFLGALKAGGIDVNGIAARILSDSCLKHNALHAAIVDLFSAPENVKIVTTNYDQMFEQVLEEKAITVPVYNAPALPLGNDISGIIHIHGNVSDPKYMVVTDEDFGKAYLTEGYASRFLIKLFESYTVLFVGYSYNDTILRYLTRAMSREHSANRYILTADTKSDWNSLGISAIFFPKRSYAVMRNGIVKLGIYAKKALWDWRNQFVEIADNPPKDLTFETQIDYCLENEDRSRVLSNCIHGVGWLELLDRKDVFSCCFSDSKPVAGNGALWANWLSDGFVGSDDISLIKLFARHGNRFSNSFSEIVLRKIVRDESRLSDEHLREYITLLDQRLTDPWIISRLIEITHERQLHHLSLHLFEKLFRSSIKLEKSIWLDGEHLEPKHSMIGDYYIVNHAWDLINQKVTSQYAPEVLSFVQKAIEEVHHQYAEMGQASDEKEPWSMSMLVVEDREKEYSKEPFHVLVQAFLQAIQALGENEDVRFYLKRGLNSKSILLRKIALRAIRESDCLNDDEKIAMICDESLTWYMEGKEQVFLLAKRAFPNASSDMQNRLLDIIEEGPNDYRESREKQYAIYNWCVWLQKADSTNERIESIIKRILSEYEFAPREHPELSIVVGDAVWVADKSPLTSKEMIEMPAEKLTAFLLDYKDDVFEGPTRWGLLNTLSECVKNNSQWATGLTDYLYKQEIDNAEIWSSLFRGLEEADLSIEEALSWCTVFHRIADVIPDVKEAAHFLWKVLQKEEMQQIFKAHEQVLFDLSVKLWNQRDTAKPSEMRLIDKTLNTATGVVLMCWIYMVSYSDSVEIPEPYIARFEEALQLNSWEREVAVCILAGHFNFLCYRDRAWCVARFEPMLTGKNKKIYMSAWEGVVYFSGRISKDTADIIAPIYLKAVKNINWLEGDARTRFIELYLTLLIFVVEKPTLKYIPEFYKSASEEIRNQFVKAIGHRLRNMDSETKLSWWDRWLKRFIENRKSNKPVELPETECSTLFMLLLRLDFVFEDAVKILCKDSIPSSIDHLFWYELNEEKLVSDHSHSVAKLLFTLLNSIKELGFGEDYIIRIAKSLQGLDEKENKQLQEALIKHGITLSLS